MHYKGIMGTLRKCRCRQIHNRLESFFFNLGFQVTAARCQWAKTLSVMSLCVHQQAPGETKHSYFRGYQQQQTKCKAKKGRLHEISVKTFFFLIHDLQKGAKTLSSHPSGKAKKSLELQCLCLLKLLWCVTFPSFRFPWSMTSRVNLKIQVKSKSW